MNKTLRNLALDVAAGVGYLVALYPGRTGLRWHEWLGLAVFGALLTHLLLHWRWVVASTRQLLSRLPRRSRISYILDAALLLAFLMVVVSGVIVSSVFEMPYRLGLSIASFAFWIRIHSLSSDLTVGLVLLHLGLHWRWIVRIVTVHLLGSRSDAPTRSTAAAEPSGD